MTALIRHNSKSNDTKPVELFKSISMSLVVIAPSVAAAMTLRDSRLLLHFSFLLSCAILLLMSVNIGVAIMTEPYRRDFTRFATPALLSASAVVILFAITDAVTPFFYETTSYGFLTPLVIGALALTGTAIFTEKNIVMKSYLGLNSMMLLAIWALGAAGWFTMPF